MNKSYKNQLKSQISECLELAEGKPIVRKKILETMTFLESQLNHIRAEEGYIAQKEAQKRLRDTSNAERNKEQKDLENILERTAFLDSAVRAVNLERLIQRKWN